MVVPMEVPQTDGGTANRRRYCKHMEVMKTHGGTITDGGTAIDRGTANRWRYYKQLEVLQTHGGTANR